MARSRALGRYLATVVVSGVGDWFTYVALTTIAATSAGEGSPWRALSIGAVALAHTVPRVMLAPVAGWLADRFDRRTLLAIAELLRGLVVLAMAWAALHGAIVLLHVLHMLRMGLGSISEVAGRAALPSWVAREDLGRANAKFGVAWSTTFVVGIVLGGGVAARFGPEVALAVDAVSFFVAAALTLTLPRAPARDPHAPSRRGSVLEVLRADRNLVRAAFHRAPLGFVHGAAFVFSALAIGGSAEAVAGAALGIGSLHGARALGNAAGSAVALRAFFRWAATPLGAAGAAIAVVGRGGPFVLLVAGALWGFGMGANWTFATTTMQRSASGEWLGRVVATDAFAYTVAAAVGGVVAVALGGAPRVPLAIGLFVVACITSALVVPRWDDGAKR